jgi:putative membrane protein
MHNLSKKFLSETEQARIKEAVASAEKKTSGEIVPMIVSASHNYPLSNFTGGLALSLLTGLIVVLITRDQNLWIFLAVFMASFFIYHEIVKHVLPLKKLFISHYDINEEVEEAALKSFYQNGLYKTRDETGVLIFISVFEKKVYILADKGINSKIAPGTWKGIVDIITDGIRQKKQCDAICEAIKLIGDILNKEFPIKKDDTDELSNLIIGE